MEAIAGKIEKFQNESKPEDDLTIVVVKLR
jgi:serine phosphatase RsbU (regulator of sigma subunit)